MRTTSIFVIAALLYSSMGLNGSIKKRLGEVNANGLVQVEGRTTCPDNSSGGLPDECPLPILVTPDLDFCTCDSDSGTLPPPGGSAQLQVFEQSALVTSGQVVSQVPNTASVTNCEAECCACAAENEVSASSA